jgi:hypothetical protein
MEIVKYLRLQWDRVAAGLALAGAVVALLIGYLGTAHTEYIAKQIPYLISGGLVGMMLLTVAAVLWISADLRDEWRMMHRQNEAIRQEQLDRRGTLAELVRQELAAQGGSGRT